MNNFVKKINIFKGDKRTIKARKNIIASAVLKVLDGIIYLALVPITLNYLNPYEYGIWLTLSSILMWMNSFDIGLGNGLRNKLAEALAKKEAYLGKCYISTTYVIIFTLMFITIIGGFILYPYIDWYEILNTNVNKIPHLNKIVLYTFLVFCINFIFKIIGNVYLALQLPSINTLFTVLGHLFSFVIIYILTKLTEGSLMFVALTYAGAPLLIYLIASIITYTYRYPNLSPSLKYFRKEYIKDLFGIGLQFLIIQIASIILFSTTNIIISHIFGPESVTPYNIVYRYYSIVPMIMTLILSPMWSATTDAFVKQDILWIKTTLKNINKTLIIVFILVVIMVILSPYVYKIWIGSSVIIPESLSILMAFYIMILISSTSYSNFLNGIGKLRVQMITAIIVATIFIPLSIFLSRLFGLIGVIMAMSIINLPVLILNYVQLIKILDNKAIGVWNK